MQFLWKSQLKKERGKFLPREVSSRKKMGRKERLVSTSGRRGVVYGLMGLWTLFLGTSVYLVLFSSYLVLGEPHISGLRNIAERDFSEQVRMILSERYFGTFARNRYFLVRTDALARELQTLYPLIRTIEVRRIFPNTLSVSIEERETIILWCSDEHCLHALENGAALPVSPVYTRDENSLRTIVLHDLGGQDLVPGERVFDPEFVSFPVHIKKLLEEQLGISLEQDMTLSSRFANELRVKTTEGWEIFLGTRIPTESSLQALRLLLEKEIRPEWRKDVEYIDLRTENKVFYRYRENSEGSRSLLPVVNTERKVDEAKKPSSKKPE